MSAPAVPATVPAVGSKSSGSTPVIVAIILVLGLAIMYLFTRIRKQDQMVERMRKENQQQLNDQDVVQLTKRYLQSQECQTYIQDLVVPLVDGLCLTYISRQYPVIIDLQTAVYQRQSLAQEPHDNVQTYSYDSHLSSGSLLSEPVSANHDINPHYSPEPVFAVSPPAAQPVNEVPLNVVEPAIEVPLNVVESVIDVPLKVVESASQVPPNVVESVIDIPLKVVESASQVLPPVVEPVQQVNGEHLDESDASEPGSSPDSSSPPQPASSNSSPESTPRKKKKGPAAKKAGKKRPVGVQKKAGVLRA